MNLSRRSFIKLVISAGAVAACPWPMSAQAEPGRKKIPKGKLTSETNKVCHQVKDGHELPLPEPSAVHDIVIVGGGPSGLAAADEIQNSDFLLLEKENHVGGNAYTESWRGLNYSTGAAWASIFSPEVDAIFKRWKFDMKLIKGVDAAYFNGVWVKDFWNGKVDNPNLDKLPYPDSVKESMREFCRHIGPIDIEQEKERLDRMPFSEILKNYTPELKAFWDAFGPSNWGAVSEDTSAYLGIQAARDWWQSERYSFEGGMGMGSRKIYEHLSPEAQNRILLNAAVYKVRKQNGKVLVSYMLKGKPRTVQAKAVVMATPKFITKYIVEDLPLDQVTAMGHVRFAPFLVYNLCFNKVVYNQNYDNWIIGSKNLTDFIPADWVTHADGGDLNRPQIITVYAPKPESLREDLLEDKKVLAMAKSAVEELTDLFPGWLKHLEEVRIYRRGHPMYMSTPGFLTKIQPVAGRDFPPIYFAHSDSMGELSDLAYAGLSGIRAAQKAAKHI